VHKFPEETGGRSPDLAERDVDVDQQVIIALLAELAAVGARAGDKLQSLTLGTWPLRRRATCSRRKPPRCRAGGWQRTNNKA
jgi:hypothetical protein